VTVSRRRVADLLGTVRDEKTYIAFVDALAADVAIDGESQIQWGAGLGKRDV
jgi:hypothetical protein